ncbi:hypothetical protein L5515_008859 [Caenorhabditis briggsae]|uniref:Uncharacterized protein n=1 Tax=Caenorhabditis briggsae TaxID=6238 RepID=A0AAE9F241_CAEBR|nr:hypothetical protein L5515_008859 [Caenorhabditis briggsae]
MEEDCVIIEKSKLIITGEYDDVESVKETLAKIRVIEAGVEVVGTSYEVFDFLRQVEEIKNPNGPALTFKNNKNLKSIKMENLKLLAGKEEDVLFDNDNFPIEVYENSNALHEMLHLKAAARPSLANKKCSVEFIRIVEPEVSGSGWLLYTLIATSLHIIFDFSEKFGKMKTVLLVVPIFFFLPQTTEGNLKVFTQECILKAEYSSCEMFNSCCDLRCSRARQKRSTCTINGTGINEIQTECICSKPLQQFEVPYTRKSKHSRLDLIAGILFIFVLDMLLLSFTI